MMLPPSPMEGVPVSLAGSSTAFGSGPTGHALSAPSACPCHKGHPAKR
jgi:hypothetical protein